MFNRFLLWIFNSPIRFSFSLKNGKRNTVHFSLFSFMKKFRKELLKKIKINFMVIFKYMVYTLFKSKFVSSPLRFSAVQWSCGHHCILMFILLATTFIFLSFLQSIVSEAAIVRWSLKVIPKVIHKHFNRKRWSITSV